MVSLINKNVLSNVAIDHLISLALLHELTVGAACIFATSLLEVIEGHDFTTHKLVFEVGVDYTGSLWGLDATADRPSTYLIRTSSEVTNEVQGVLATLSDLRKSALHALP